VTGPSGQRRIALHVGSLGLGGAQRVILWLARHLIEQGHVVVLVTDEADEVTDFFAPPPDVVREAIGLSEGRSGVIGKALINIARVRRLRSILKRHRIDTVLAMLPRACVLATLATRGLDCRVVLAERNAPWHRVEEFPWEQLRRGVYRLASCAVGQTEPVADWLRREAGMRDVRIVPNAVQLPLARLDPALCPPNGGRLLLSVGTKPWQKGFDLLLEAFVRVAPRYPDWRLAIAGLSPGRAENGITAADLMARADEEGLAKRVLLPGRVGNMADWYDVADAFVLSSRFEGFPNVLIEAMSHGCASVAFDCETGPSDIVRDEIDGLLVPDGDVNALADALDRIMSDSDLRARLSEAAPAITERFDKARVAALWHDALDIPLRGDRSGGSGA